MMRPNKIIPRQNQIKTLIFETLYTQQNIDYMHPLRLSILLKSLLLLASCASEVVNPRPATLSTKPPMHIRVTTVTLSGEVTSNGGGEVFERGVCWGFDRNPTTGGSHLPLGAGNGFFTAEIEALEPNRTYYARAYAENVAGIAYGNEITFQTNYMVMDVDSNLYHGITVGTQVWLQEDLRVTRYRNGESIPHISDDSQWVAATSGAWCSYNSSFDQGEPYGRLYNWYVVSDERGVCPLGWRVPRFSDWEVLTDYLNGEMVAGGKLKDTSHALWESPTEPTDESTIFNALPGGYRSFTLGSFHLRGRYGYWWMNNESSQGNGLHVTLVHNSASIGFSSTHKNTGFSIRCIKAE